MWAEQSGVDDSSSAADENASYHYTIDLAASLTSGELAVTRRRTERAATPHERWEERHVASTLSRSRLSRSSLFFNALVPLARARRCDVVVAAGAAPVPLEAEDQPFVAQVLVAERDDGGLTVRAELQRGEQRIDVGDLTALLPRDDVAFFGPRVVRVRTEDAAPILTRILAEGPWEVPPLDVRDTLRLLWARCGPRILRLPASYALTLGKDLPFVTRVVLETPSRADGRRGPFEVRLVFDYDGVEVPWRETSDLFPDFERRRIVRRDRALEHDALDELLKAGFRARHTLGGDADLVLATSKLIPAVSALPPSRFVVEADGLRMRASTNASMSIKSGIDWFDLRANIAFDGVVAPMPAILEAVRRGDGLVRLGPHGTGVLPATWLKRLEQVMPLAGGDGEDDALRFQHAQVSLVEEIVASEATPISWEGPIAELRKRLAAQAKALEAPAPPAPAAFQGHLREYQRAGVAWMRGLEELGFSGCLADDMGLGKTIQVLAFLAGRKAEGRSRGPTLVIAPRSVVHNWLDEARRFTPSLRAAEHVRGSTKPSDLDLIVTTYGLLRSDLETLRQVTFDYVVLDEAHAIKNPASTTAKAANKLVARSRLALTGTPVENHLGEIASLFAFLNPGMLGPSVKRTAKRGFDADKSELARIGRGLSPFLLRRRKREVAAELPPRIEQTILVELGEAQRAIYDRVRRHYRSALLTSGHDVPSKRGFEVFAALLRLRQLAVHPALLDPASAAVGSAKMDALFEHLEPIVALGRKSLVFSQFTSMLDLVERELVKQGIPFARLDGNTPDRRDVVARFQRDPAIPVFLVSLKAGGVGLNLTAAEYVFLLDPWWNPAVEAQAIDRAHRMGQTRTVVAYRFVCTDTIEDRLMDLQQKKRDLVASVLGEQEGVSLSTMTTEDLDALLS
ncbi:MAG: DEAD/DEAH box helicase [Deltaproteobacteria bacterium]|nr:DEAD/DEAH box helicase [Deltaproteobacteria bacterium]